MLRFLVLTTVCSFGGGSTVGTRGCTKIPFTLCDVPAPLRVSSILSILSKANVVGIVVKLVAILNYRVTSLSNHVKNLYYQFADLVNLKVLAAILAAILDLIVTSRSNHVNTYFIGLNMVQNMGVEPIFVLPLHILQSYGLFKNG